MTKTEAQNQILARVQVYLAKAKELYGVTLNPTVCFKLKGTTMGKAFTTGNKLQFNLTALEVEGGWDHLIDHTVGHEVAHLVQYSHPSFPKDRRSNPPHGRYWQKVMWDFGIRPERCHSFKMPSARTTVKITFRCRCREHEVSTTIANRIAKGRTYSCKACKSQIVKA